MGDLCGTVRFLGEVESEATHALAEVAPFIGHELSEHDDELSLVRSQRVELAV
jgi:hypothetical protein